MSSHYLPPSRGRKRFLDQDPEGIPPARAAPEEITLDEDMVKKIATKCAESTKLYRDRTWTEYARITHQLVKHNFGLWPEPAIRCMGCRRLLPPTLITADHITPKSNKEGLRRAIAYKLDRLDQVDVLQPTLYMQCVNQPMKSASIRNGRIGDALNTIKSYDDNLADDLRNIQPLCWSCNGIKGTRTNEQFRVLLHPQPSLPLPWKPWGEAPF